MHRWPLGLVFVFYEWPIGRWYKTLESSRFAELETNNHCVVFYLHIMKLFETACAYRFIGRGIGRAWEGKEEKEEKEVEKEYTMFILKCHKVWEHSSASGLCRETHNSSYERRWKTVFCVLFFLGSSPLGDDDLWFHHIGEFSLSPFFHFSFVLRPPSC